MKKYLKTTFATVLLSAAIATSALPAARADGEPAGAPATLQSYTLNDSLRVEVKSVLNERVKDGTRLGAVVRLTNTTGKLTRVPDYELRLKTEDGTEYTLQPSATNVPSVNGKATRELSYMLTVDRSDDIKIADIEWVDVDLYVYPKKETLMLDIPAAGMIWEGKESAIEDSNAMRKWGESFTLPSLNSPLVYKPVDLTRDFNGQSPVSVVQVLVENPTSDRQALPDLAMDGKSATDVYSGQLVEQGPIVLEAGEKRYVHFAIQTDIDTVLQSLNVLTVEKYASAEGQKTFNVGHLNIVLPTATVTAPSASDAKYKLGTPIAFDKLNKIIHQNLEVSLVELHVQDNDRDGFKTAIAKFKLLNKSDRPLPVPSFATELVSTDGYVYAGFAQAITAQRVIPSGATTVSYSFTVPKSQESTDLELRLLDAQTVKPYKSVIAAIRADAQLDDTIQVTELNMYPFKLKMNNWTASANFQGVYTYKLKLDLDIQQDPQAIVDSSSPKLQIDVVGSDGRVIASLPNLGLTGVNALINGSNEISLSAATTQLEIPFTFRIYESFTNTNGEVAKRLLTTLK
ncbi:hypothetical protein SD70_05365 [Gordoniibacillus kamchatkensis]|uniref:Uncharacterized protein n=1 Tax=Gordoniibacillus kamchatkensis TaxID=1590651 RepID=A0ABR5ALI8_9BACL|nr:hypothetical protein [Paenibacillus sp. VKM B-2647]KIL41782.1 hypothetical protein SD70_05365 [Paenibacillus sp. VKM B-2647]